jgi:Bacterial archaeo-eukaryotic release factor family 10
MGQGYTEQERAQQVASTQEQAKIRWGYKRREVRPQTLLLALAEQPQVSREWLREIMHEQYTNPVVSLYLNWTAQKAGAGPKGSMLSTFHELKPRVMEERKEYVASLTREQKFRLEHDLSEIESFLREDVPAGDLRSLVIFRSGEQVNHVARLLVPTRDALVIGADPYVLPLEAALEENDAVLLIEAEKAESRFLVDRLGAVQQVARIETSFATEDYTGSVDPGHAQRHRLTHLEWHLKRTSDTAYQLLLQHAFERVIILAELRVWAVLEKFLRDPVKERIIGHIENSPGAEKRDRRELIESVLQEYRAKKEAQAIEALNDYRPGVELVSSLREVLEASNLFLVRQLIVSAGLQQPGFVCRNHHYLAQEAGTCPFDGTKLAPVENIVDEAVEIARLHGVDVLVVQQRAELMNKYGGIAAVVYPTAQQAMAAAEGRTA